MTVVAQHLHSRHHRCYVHARGEGVEWDLTLDAFCPYLGANLLWAQNNRPILSPRQVQHMLDETPYTEMYVHY